MIGESPAISLEEMVHMRRALYTALLPFFDLEELLSVMWYWEEEYATAQEELIEKYVADVCLNERAIMRNSVLHNIRVHLVDQAAKLEDDPYRLMVAYKAGKLERSRGEAIKPGAPTENMRLFARLLDNMNSLLESDNRYATYLVREYVEQALAEYQGGLSIEQVNELRKWMGNKGGPLEYDYTAKQMSAVLHLFYIGACEYFGPEKGSRYHATMIKSAEGRRDLEQYLADLA
jgi:hypothetical protein